MDPSESTGDRPKKPAPTCGACGVALEEGFLIDHAHYGIPYATHWASGPRKSGFAGVHLAGRRKIPLRALRCPRCERVEIYAPAPHPPPAR